MNIKRIITVILFAAIVMVLSGCSESLAVKPQARIVGSSSDQSTIQSQMENETPWWQSGNIDNSRW
jgi:hypothetical protein